MDSELKHRLIDKILLNDNEKLLNAIDQILESVKTPGDQVALTDEQKRMLEMSENDIKNGYTITQKKMDEDDLKWLQEM